MKIKILIWNIFKNQLPGLHKKLRVLANQSDFLMIQEHVSDLHLEGFYVIDNYTFTIPHFREKICTGTALMSKRKPESVLKYKTKNKELGFTTHKGLIVAEYKINNKSLFLINIHALNFVTNSLWEKEFKNIIELVPKSGSVVFAGDFNTWNPARFNYLERELKKIGFKYANYEHNIILRLDHVFYRNLELVEVECLVNVHNSDHYPIVTEFEMI